MIIIPGLSFLRVIIYDILFSLFAFFVEPVLLPVLTNIADPYSTGSDIRLGILLLFALFAEVPGIYLKFQMIASEMLLEKRAEPGKRLKLEGGMLVLILHIAIGVILMIFAFQALGYRMHDNENIFAVFFLAALAREGIIIYIIFGTRIPLSQPSYAGIKNTTADLLVFFFSIIALTSTWRVVTFSDKPMVTDSIIELILFLFFSAVLFLMYYAGSNMTTIYEGMIMAKKPGQRLCRKASLFIVTVSVLYNMFDYRNPARQVDQPYNRVEKLDKIETEKELMKTHKRDKNLNFNEKTW